MLRGHGLRLEVRPRGLVTTDGRRRVEMQSTGAKACPDGFGVPR